MTMTASSFGCVNNTIRLRSGRYFDLADPKPDQFTFGDIAGALSKICRFGGQIDSYYSVAEHSVLCSKVAADDGLPLDTQIAVLMHDAAEAFCGDMVKPLKVMLPHYREIEAAIETVVAEKFTIDFRREGHSIREIDHAMLIQERRCLFSADNVVWVGEKEVRQLAIIPNCWRPDHAEAAFVNRARMLGVRPIES